MASLYREPVMMRVGLETALQMDRGGCSQTRGNARSILQRKAYVSCQGYVGILKSARFLDAKQGGTADKVVFALDGKSIFRSRAFCLCPNV